MNLKDCIKFTNENHLCSLATIENDQPRVRTLGFWFADETGFYFQTHGKKEFAQQLKLNPKTEVCFHKNEKFLGTMLRIAGKVEFLNDTRLKEKVLNDRPFLKHSGLTAENSDLLLFRITHGQAHFWTMEDELKPKK